MGDGELDEGTTWEASLFASHHRLSNLVAVVDRNHLQSLTDTENTMRLEPISEKFEALGWHVLLVDGHDHSDLRQALEHRPLDQPMMIIAETVKGKGVSFMENSVAWHYQSPDAAQLSEAIHEVIARA
jgi:transketolase